MTDKEFVKQHWDGVRLDRDFGFHFWLGSSRDASYLFSKEQDDVTVAWAEAAEFTRQRLEEIRQVEEEIVVTTNAALSATRDVHKVMSGECATLCRGLEGAFAVCSVRHGRVILRLQAALSELKKGMKQ